MPVILEGNAALVRGTPLILFNASVGQLPGIFSGEIDLNALTDVNDAVSVSFLIKYSSGGAEIERATVPPTKKVDSAIGFTPMEQTYGYKIVVLLENSSPTATATLPFKINKSAVPA